MEVLCHCYGSSIKSVPYAICRSLTVIFVVLWELYLSFKKPPGAVREGTVVEAPQLPRFWCGVIKNIKVSPFPIAPSETSLRQAINFFPPRLDGPEMAKIHPECSWIMYVGLQDEYNCKQPLFHGSETI